MREEEVATEDCAGQNPRSITAEKKIQRSSVVSRSAILLAAVRGGLTFFGEADPPHGRGVRCGAKVGNGVAVGAGVAVAAGFGVATCACAPAKKATKPTRTHTPTKAIPDRIRVLVAGCRS